MSRYEMMDAVQQDVSQLMMFFGLVGSAIAAYAAITTARMLDHTSEVKTAA